MVSSITDETKEFIITSNGEACFVEVTSTSDLCDVRQLIIDEFDPEQLPSLSEQFAFKINGIRQSQKQEKRKNAFELLERGATVEIIPTRVNHDERKRKIVNERDLCANDDDNSISGNSKKKMKVDPSCAVTPFQSSSLSSSSDNKKATANTSTTGTIDTSKSSSVGLSTNLDKKVFSSNINYDQENNNSDSDANDEMDLGNERDNNNNDKTMTSGRQDFNGGDFVAGDSDNDDDDNKELFLHGIEKEGRENNDGILKYFVKTVAEQVCSVMKSPLTKTKHQKDEEDEATEDGSEKEATSAAPGLDSAVSSDDDLLQDIEKDESAEMGNEVVSDALITEEGNPHKEADEAKEKSRQVLKELTDMLNNNPNFCSEARKDDWLEEINQLTKKSSPQTVFGVLGNTGV